MRCEEEGQASPCPDSAALNYGRGRLAAETGETRASSGPGGPCDGEGGPPPELTSRAAARRGKAVP
jgi:hypothetical protein